MLGEYCDIFSNKNLESIIYELVDDTSTVVTNSRTFLKQ